MPSDDIFNSLVGLIGAIVGALTVIASDGLRRKWERKERKRESLIRQAEELAGYSANLYEWQAKCLSDSFDGKMDAPPSVLFRIGLLVSGYLPSAEKLAGRLTKAVGDVHYSCAQIALDVINNGQERKLPQREKTDAAQRAMADLSKACVELSEEVGRIVRGLD